MLRLHTGWAFEKHKLVIKSSFDALVNKHAFVPLYMVSSVRVVISRLMGTDVVKIIFQCYTSYNDLAHISQWNGVLFSNETTVLDPFHYVLPCSSNAKNASPCWTSGFFRLIFCTEVEFGGGFRSVLCLRGHLANLLIINWQSALCSSADLKKKQISQEMQQLLCQFSGEWTLFCEVGRNVVEQERAGMKVLRGCFEDSFFLKLISPCHRNIVLNLPLISLYSKVQLRCWHLL